MPTIEEFRERIRARKAQTATSAVIGADANPEAAAKAIELAPQTNMPPTVLRMDLQSFEQRIKARRNTELVKSSPALQTFVNENPLHAEAAADEFDLLDEIDKTWQRTAWAWNVGAVESQAGAQLGLARTMTPTGMIEQSRLDQLRAQATQASTERAQVPWALMGPMMAGSFFGGLSHDTKVGGVPGALGGAVAAGPPGAVAGYIGGTAISGGLSAYGGSLDALDQAEKETGQQINPYVKQTAAGIIGGMAYAANFIGMKGPTQQALLGLARETLVGAAVQPTITRAVGRAGVEIGKAGLSGATLMGLLSAGTSIVQDLAKTVSEGDWETVFNDPEKRTQAAQLMVRAMGEGAAMIGGFHVPGVGANFVRDLATIRAARDTAAAHDGFMTQGANSKLRQATPEVFRAFAEKVVGQREISIGMDQILEADAVEAVRPLVPDFDRQADVALATGGSIQVPYANYLARIDPEIDGMLREGIAWEPGGLSLREAEGIEAWHASPHKFDAFKFDTSTFRTGEGAATYGAGLYFAENPAVSGPGGTYDIQFQQSAQRKFIVDDQPFDVNNSTHRASVRIQEELDLGRDFDTAKANVLSEAQKDLTRAKNAKVQMPDILERYQGIVSSIEEMNFPPKVKTYTDASVYRVKIKAKPEEMLDWDAPFEDQPIAQQVVDAYNKATGKDQKIEDFASLKGGEVLRVLQSEVGELKASNALREAGIPGLRYYDQGSRVKVQDQKWKDPRWLAAVELDDQKGNREAAIEAVEGRLEIARLLDPEEFPDAASGHEAILQVLRNKEEKRDFSEFGTRNMVIFDDSRIEILDRNGEPLKGAEREAALAEYQLTREPEQVEGELRAEVGPAPVIEPALATPEIIDDSAVLINGKIYSGNSHLDAYEKWIAEGGDEKTLSRNDALSGYVTSRGRFITEEEARVQAGAKNAGRAKGRVLKSEPALATPEGALAADTVQAIAEDTAKELWLQPMFRDAKSAGMTEMEFRRYSQRLEKWTNNVNEKALSAARREVKRRQTAEWKQTAETFRADVTRELNLQKDIQTYDFLTTGRLVGEDIPVPLEAQVKLDWTEATNLTDLPLPKGTTTKKNGAHPDDMAELFKFRSGEELVKALAALEQGRAGRPMSAYRKALIEEETTQRVEEVLGRLDENIEREAQETALQLEQQDLLAEDLAILGKQIGAPPFEIEALREWGRDAFAKTPLRRARDLNTFTKNVGKAGRNAELALLAGDIKKAFEAKGNQLLSHILRVEAQKFSREVARAEKRFAKLGRKGTGREKDKRIDTDQEYMNQIHGLLARHGYKVRRKTPELAETTDATPIEAFIQEQQNLGYSLYVPKALRGNQIVDIDAQPASYFRELADAIKSLEHNGKEVKTITFQGEKIDLDTAVDAMVDQANSVPARFKKSTEGLGNILKTAVYTGDNWLTQTKRLFDDLDNFNPFGPFNSYAMDRLRAAHGAGKDYRFELATKAKPLKPPRGSDRKVAQNIFPEPLMREGFMSLTRGDMRVVALHMGSMENTEKLIQSYFPDTRANTQLYIDRRNQILDWLNTNMKPEDWQWTQKVWNFFEDMWPDIKRAMEKEYGVARPKKNAAPIDTPSGRVSGGYFPLFYDPVRSAPDGDGIFTPNYQGTDTWHGFMEEIKEGTQGRLVQIKNAHRMMPFRINQMAHHLSMHDAIVDVQKLLLHPKVYKAVQQSIGPEYATQFKPFLQSVANRYARQEGALDTLAEFSQGARGRVTTGVFGLLASVVATPSMGNFVKSITRLSTHPIDTINVMWFDEDLRNFAFNNSPTIRGWMREGYNRNLDDMAARPKGVQRAQRIGQKLGFGLTGYLEKGFGYLTWSTEYLHAKKLGKTDAEAITYAEKILNDDYPRADILELAPIMRDGGEGMRLLTWAYGFFDFSYNRLRRMKGLAQSGGRDIMQRRTRQGTAKFVDAFTEFMAFYITQAALGYLISGGELYEEDDSVGETMLKAGGGFVAGTIFLGRDLFRLASGDSRGIQHPAVRIVDGMVKGLGKEAASLYDDGEVTDEWVKNIYTPTAMALGLPAVQLGRTGQFIRDYIAGDQDPDGFFEWVRGIVSGKTEEEK